VTGVSALAAVPAGAQRTPSLPTIELRPGLVITESVRILARTYRIIPHPSLDSAVVTIRGDDVTVDFNGATLDGMAREDDPDLSRGVGIRIEGGERVRITNARIRGFRIGVLATGTRGLELVNNDLSYNWKPRLFSLVEHESLVDWLSFHQNEKDEWLRFGAAIHLRGVTGGNIRGNRVTQGMNALLMTRSDSLVIRDNDFSFNSGLGIGLYRSSHNTIVRNRLDYNVRGYSHGWYRRGQDSADLLLYEQSRGNVVAFNSATHGGDGLFLWAGQRTMDTGQGGANDNWFFANDFSYAPANGMEATFSRNHFIGNRVEGSDYGLWGGYSYESRVAQNCFRRNRIGIAIEHGQENEIVGNHFDRDTTAISLWANPIEPSDWGYPKHRDTRSRQVLVRQNRFTGNRVAVRAANTAGLDVRENRASRVDSFTVLRDTAGYAASGNSTAGGRGGGPAVRDPCVAPPPLELLPDEVRARAVIAGRTIPATPLSRLDRSAMVVDEWGPFDWRSPKLWPADSARASPLRLRVLGPAGTWRLVGQRGLASISRRSGRIGDTLRVTPDPDSLRDWEVVLEYRGTATVAPRGAVLRAGVPYQFRFGRFEPPMDWLMRVFAWGDATDPRADSTAAPAVFRSAPLLTQRVPRLDYMWFRPPAGAGGIPATRWALEASAVVDLPPGEYTLRTISDDGIRVWVDRRLAIDRWTPHGSEVDNVRLDGGRHELRVQYYQVEGWTELRVEVLRGRIRSAGSPGPH
jgi:nitrous oxidase accessory protein NosD